ncbi:flagellin FliC [bacterium]|nr:flagellin FliC [bacterium]
MALTVNNDTSPLSALRQAQISSSEVGLRLARIASGLRINRASDDAAGLAVSEQLSTQRRGLDVAGRNIQDFTSLAQTAEAGLGEIQNMSQRINELAIQASNGTLTGDDRRLIQEEISQLTQEIDRQATATEFNGQPLLTGTFSGTAQVGPNAGDTLTLSISATDASSLGLADVDVTTQAGAQNAISSAQGAVNSVATQRADIGATVNRLQSSFNFTGAAGIATTAAESRIRDADVAAELIGLTTAQAREKAGLFSVAQGNLNQQNVLRLLGD